MVWLEVVARSTRAARAVECATRRAVRIHVVNAVIRRWIRVERRKAATCAVQTCPIAVTSDVQSRPLERLFARLKAQLWYARCALYGQTLVVRGAFETVCRATA